MTGTRATLLRIRAEIDGLIEALPRDTDDALLAALRDATGGRWLTSGEIWRLAIAQAEAAGSTGEPQPELPAALEAEGLCSTHSLGRWLAAREGKGIERGGTERGGALWRACEADST